MIGLCYRSPNSSEDNNRKLREQIANLKSVERITHILVMGGFNFSEIDWVSGTVNADENSEPQKFYDSVQDEFLEQNNMNSCSTERQETYQTSRGSETITAGLYM